MFEYLTLPGGGTKTRMVLKKKTNNLSRQWQRNHCWTPLWMDYVSEKGAVWLILFWSVSLWALNKCLTRFEIHTKYIYIQNERPPENHVQSRRMRGKVQVPKVPKVLKASIKRLPGQTWNCHPFNSLLVRLAQKYPLDVNRGDVNFTGFQLPDLNDFFNFSNNTLRSCTHISIKISWWFIKH